MDDLIGQPISWATPARPAVAKTTIFLPPSGQHTLDPKPRAAYLLGYSTFEIRFWYEAFWKFCEQERIRERSRSAFAELRGAMKLLFAEIHPNVSFDLDRAIVDFEEKTGRSLDTPCPLPVAGTDAWRTNPVPFRIEWEAVKALADQALDPTRELRRLYDFGSRLGELRLWLWRFGPGSIIDQVELERFHTWIDGGGSDPLPDIRPLVKAALWLPQELIKNVPYIETMVELFPLLEDIERDKYLKTYLRHHGELSPRFGAAEEVDHAVVSAMLDNLDDSIRAWLGSSDMDTRSSLPLDERTALSWDRGAGELRLGTRVIGTFAPQAISARKVMEQFQLRSCANEMPNFFREQGHPNRMKEARRTLNKIEHY